MAESSPTEYLNTDLDLICDIDPALLVSKLESRGLFVHVHREGEQFRVLCEDHNASEPEPNIVTLLDAIDALPLAARAIWNRCSLREFNVGYNCGNDPHSFSQGLSNATLRRVADCNSSLRVTLYRNES